MFAKSADPATMEEVQVLLEDSVKGSIPAPNIFVASPLPSIRMGFPVVKEVIMF